MLLSVPITSGTSAYELNLFYTFGENGCGCICHHVELMNKSKILLNAFFSFVNQGRTVLVGLILRRGNCGSKKLNDWPKSSRLVAQ